MSILPEVCLGPINLGDDLEYDPDRRRRFAVSDSLTSLSGTLEIVH